MNVDSQSDWCLFRDLFSLNRFGEAQVPFSACIVIWLASLSLCLHPYVSTACCNIFGHHFWVHVLSEAFPYCDEFHFLHHPSSLTDMLGGALHGHVSIDLRAISVHCDEPHLLRDPLSPLWLSFVKYSWVTVLRDITHCIHGPFLVHRGCKIHVSGEVSWRHRV